MRVTRGALSSIALVATVALPAAAQQQTDASFNWNGKVPAGRWIRIRNLNGPITVSQASGDNAEVTAVKRWRRGDPAVVRFETKPSSDGSVTICALWGERSSCDERNYETRGDRGTRDNDVSVEFRVLLPKGVKASITTINGNASVDGATTDVEATTINGEVNVNTAGGRVTGTNVNGDVRARISRLDPDGSVELTTVNGSAILEVPADLNADLDLQTLMGSLVTNFELTLSGRLNPHHIQTHIGRPGGPRIKLRTVNGNVELKKP